MSISSAIQLANNSLLAQQIGLQVVGQNISNANTPGYIRESVIYGPAPTQRNGGVLLGLGVSVIGVVQRIDRFIEERLRGATSDQVASETQQQTFQQLETLIGETGDTDLSTSMNNFFNSIQDLLSQPESDSVRELAVLRGKALAGDISRLADRTNTVFGELNDRVAKSSDNINRYLEEVRALNVRIAQTESSDVSNSDAVGLRDRRMSALTELSKLFNIQVSEQSNGSVTVIHQGEVLVSGGLSRPLETYYRKDSQGKSIAYLRIKENQAPITPTGGEVAGLVSSRDEAVQGFLNGLDDFARTLTFEFNRVYSSGQGLNGFSSLTSESGVTNTTSALDSAGLNFEPQNGSFEIMVRNKQTGITKRTRIDIDLNGFDHDTSLDDLRQAIDGIDGISATIDGSKRLRISTESSQDELAFANDTSGVLAALGINTFFTGSSALNMGVNQQVLDDPRKFAASRGGIGEDSDNAVALADFLDRPLDTKGQATISAVYDAMVGQVTQASSVATATAEGFRAYAASVEGQKLAVSGVNLDEEVVQMMTHQHVYQVSARFISTLAELLDVLVNL